jgi:hypothetical protein
LCRTPPSKKAQLHFAAITNDPPEEVSAAGHDRCIIPIQEKSLPGGRKKSMLSTISTNVNDRITNTAKLHDYYA